APPSALFRIVPSCSGRKRVLASGAAGWPGETVPSGSVVCSAQVAPASVVFQTVTRWSGRVPPLELVRPNAQAVRVPGATTTSNSAPASGSSALIVPGAAGGGGGGGGGGGAPIFVATGGTAAQAAPPLVVRNTSPLPPLSPAAAQTVDPSAAASAVREAVLPSVCAAQLVPLSVEP